MTSWRSAPLPKHWKRTQRRILIRDGYVCRIGLPGCEGKATDVDHIVPAAKGGGEEDSNLQSACGHCHDRKTIEERRAPRRRPAEPHPGEMR